METMPFGKHKGEAIADIEDSYLVYIFELESLRDPLKAAIYKEVDRRGGIERLKVESTRSRPRGGSGRVGGAAPARTAPSTAAQAYRDLADGLAKAAAAALKIAELAG